MRIHVDDDSCCGHGVCVGLCPQVFALTDDGYAEAVDAEIPTQWEAAVTEAIARCPEQAIQTH
ncbi:ferredoxin [Nocardia callitridis]|uniref:Ferredoxin n=1 Tax=Nocardia callitridis TaxID=648753 RepID=A0ABP9KAR4_9NOCA